LNFDICDGIIEITIPVTAQNNAIEILKFRAAKINTYLRA